ncbi:MAG: GNAT family N-acetyltransferase [Bacteroidota bacterium]
MNDPIRIRKAEKKDEEAIWSIIQAVIQTGDTYVFDPATPQSEMMAYWCGADKHTFVASIQDRIVGTFIIKDNFPDLGAHVANASFMTKPTEFGKGIGRTMGAHALQQAKQLGYYAMQFNIVVKSNQGAIRLWQKLGFQTIGEIPDAFDHQQNGYTNALIMWRKL